MAITPLELDSLKPQSKPYTIREKQRYKKDGVLAFKVLPSGDIDSYFIYYVEGKEKQKKIGRYGNKPNTMSLKAIHDKYNDLSKEYKRGVDVKVKEQETAAAEAKEKQAAAAAERKRQLQGSFQQLLDAYVEYARVSLGAHYYRAVKGAFEFNLQGFDTTIKADQITKADIRSILKPIEQRGSLVMANRMRSYLSAAFEWAIESNEDEGISTIAGNVQFYVRDNPVRGVKKPLKEEEPIDRFLTEVELYTFWKALDGSSMALHRKNILRLMICLGCRVEALAGLRWSEVDFEDRLISIPPSRSKNGLHWVIPMSDTAHGILLSNPHLHDEFLFPSENMTEPLKPDGINQAVKRLCEQASIERFTPRDLRTTFKTLSGKAGLSKEMRDRLQNHSLKDVSSKHYDRYDYLKEKREAMELWDKSLKRIISGTQARAQVLPFKVATNG